MLAREGPLTLHAEDRVGSLDLDVSLEIGAGCLALTGPSGAGKTTVLRIAAGLRRPASGTVVCGDDVWLDTSRGLSLPPERRHCGVLFQDYALFPHLGARENVAYPLRRLPRAQRRARAEEMLDRFGLLARAGARPHELSGGERQRVALARALAVDPRALLLDEPLSALDAHTRASARRTLAATLRDAGVPALLVTHDFAEAALLAGAVAVIDRGRIVQRGTPAQLATAPASAFVADLTGATVLTGTARPGPAGLTLVALDGGGELASTDTATGPVAASVHPWEIALEPASLAAHGSARNRLEVRVETVTRLGNRARIGLASPQPLTAELTGEAVTALSLEPGTMVVATWKATATRLSSR
jgi:ABC-type sulfate/molybdate transport systems ATPase subunit